MWKLLGTTANPSCIEPKSAAMNARAVRGKGDVARCIESICLAPPDPLRPFIAHLGVGVGAAAAARSEREREEVNEWMNGWRCVLDCAIYHLTLLGASERVRVGLLHLQGVR